MALTEVVDRLLANLRTAAALLMQGDPTDGPRPGAGEGSVPRHRGACHVRPPHTACSRGSSSGTDDPAETGAAHLDALRDMKRVNAHLVAASAYPVLEMPR